MCNIQRVLGSKQETIASALYKQWQPALEQYNPSPVRSRRRFISKSFFIYTPFNPNPPHHSILLPQRTPTPIPIPTQPIPTAALPPSIRHRQPIPAAAPLPHPEPTPRTHLIARIEPQSPGQLHAAEIRNADGRTGPRTQQTVKQRALVDMAPVPRPPRRQRRTRVPPHTETQRQRITNRDLRIPRVARDAIRRRRIDSPRTDAAIRRVQQQIQTMPDMQMRQLQGARQPNDQRRVQAALAAQRALLRALIRHAVLLLQDTGRQGLGRDPACERGVVVDVELQEVEEGVGHEVDGAVDLLLDPEEELQRPPRFVARREGDVLKLPVRVGDVLACLAGEDVSWGSLDRGEERERYIVRLRQVTGIGSPGL